MKDLSFEQMKDLEIKVMGNYEILQNDDDDILIYLPLELTFVPDDPVFYYDGGPHGILVGGRMPVVVCDFIHKEVRKVLESRESIFLYAAPTAEGSGQDSDAALPVEFVAKVYWQPQIQRLGQQLIALVKDGE